MVHNLALSGGGAHVMAFVGCLKVMEDRGLLKEVKEVVGASAGSLLALMLVLGFNVEEISDFMRRKVNTEKGLRVSLKDIWKITETFGIDDGESVFELIYAILEYKMVDRDITFIDLAKLTGKNLVIAVGNVNKERLEFMSVDSVPTMEVSKAIRACTSVPVLYQPVLHNEEYYVDSLFFNNFPIDFFKEWSVKHHTIGLNIVVRKEKIGSIWDYFRNLFQGTVRHSHMESNQHHMVCEVDCTEFPNFDVRNMRFDLSVENLDNLQSAGERSAEEFCDLYNSTIVSEIYEAPPPYVHLERPAFLGSRCSP